MKARIDKIFSRYYEPNINKYVVFCRIKVGKDWRFERLFFATEEEAREVSEGQIIEI